LTLKGEEKNIRFDHQDRETAGVFRGPAKQKV